MTYVDSDYAFLIALISSYLISARNQYILLVSSACKGIMAQLVEPLCISSHFGGCPSSILAGAVKL